MFKIAIALAATEAMSGVLFATEAMAAQNPVGSHTGTARGASHASVARGNGEGRATVGRAHAGRGVGMRMGQVRGGYVRDRGGYGVGYAPAYGYDNGHGTGYAPTYAYGNGYGPVVPCVPAPIPVNGCY